MVRFKAVPAGVAGPLRSCRPASASGPTASGPARRGPAGRRRPRSPSHDLQADAVPDRGPGGSRAVADPDGVVAVYWAVGLPMFNALNLNSSAHWINYVATFASVGLALLVVWVRTIATGHHEYHQSRRQGKVAGNDAQSDLATATH